MKRIEVTESEKETVTDINLVIGKGGKLCAYKEVLEYIKKHETYDQDR